MKPSPPTRLLLLYLRQVYLAQAFKAQARHPSLVTLYAHRAVETVRAYSSAVRTATTHDNETPAAPSER